MIYPFFFSSELLFLIFRALLSEMSEDRKMVDNETKEKITGRSGTARKLYRGILIRQ